MKETPRWLVAARIMAAAMTALVLYALVTTDMDQALFNASVLTMAGLVLMGWLEHRQRVSS